MKFSALALAMFSGSALAAYPPGTTEQTLLNDGWTKEETLNMVKVKYSPEDLQLGLLHNPRNDPDCVGLLYSKKLTHRPASAYISTITCQNLPDYLIATAKLINAKGDNKAVSVATSLENRQSQVSKKDFSSHVRTFQVVISKKPQ